MAFIPSFCAFTQVEFLKHFSFLLVFFSYLFFVFNIRKKAKKMYLFFHLLYYLFFVSNVPTIFINYNYKTRNFYFRCMFCVFDLTQQMAQIPTKKQSLTYLNTYFVLVEVSMNTHKSFLFGRESQRMSE